MASDSSNIVSTVGSHIGGQIGSTPGVWVSQPSGVPYGTPTPGTAGNETYINKYI